MLERGLTRRAWLERRRRWLLPLLGGASIWGCGGRAALQADEDATGAAGQSGAGSEIAAAGSGGNSGAPVVVLDEPGFGTPMALGPCVLGSLESSARGRECTFIHERRCYEDELAACACACPMGGRCILGGFLDPEGPFPVTCSLQ